MEGSMETGRREDLTAVAAAAAAIEPSLQSSGLQTTYMAAPSLAVSTGLDTAPQTIPETNPSFKKEGCRRAAVAVRSDGDGDEGLPNSKRAKISSHHGWVQTVLRQTAEMVMVLAGMGAVRGGGCSPTPIECQLAVEAYEKLASLVENVAPQQLVSSKDAYHSLLRHFKVDPPPPVVVAPPLPPPSPPEPKIAKPVVLVIYSGPPPNWKEDKICCVRCCGASSSNGNGVMGVGYEGPQKVGATESTSQDLASKDGDDKWVSVTADEQGKPPNVQSCNWSKEAATLPSAQQQHDTHQQLALGIHLLTKQHSALISSVSISNVYLSPPIACGVCKLVAHNTSSVLVCDGCESAFHVACLQLYDDPMVIPRCDWYCPKCVAASGGRPQTPKYGPLRHGHDLQGSTHGSWGLQGARSSEGSKEQVGEKSLLLYKKGIGGEVVKGTKEFVGMNLNSALASTKTTEAGAAERKLVVLEQRNGGCPAQCQITAASPTPPATQIHTETATKVTTITSEAAPQVAVTFPAVEEETVMGGKCVTRKSSSVEWVGSVVNVSQGNVYYTACSVAGVTMRLQDCALFRPESPHDPPYIARLQAFWEEKSTGAKWVKVNWCYYPSDLPVETGQPASADDNEVYESNHSDNNLVGSIHGPCQVLPPIQYQQEIERQSKETSEALPPVFLCRWFYDAPRGLFHACSGLPSDQLLRPAAETTP